MVAKPVVPYSLRLPPELYEVIAAYAEGHGLSINQALVNVLSEAFQIELK